MKVKARFSFYNSELGLKKRGEEFEVPQRLFKVLGDFVEEIKDDRTYVKQPTPKSKAGTKSRNKRV